MARKQKMIAEVETVAPAEVDTSIEIEAAEREVQEEWFADAIAEVDTSIEVSEIEAAVAHLEAIEEQSSEIEVSEAPADEVSEDEANELSWSDMLAAVSDEDVLAKRDAIAAEIDARRAFERSKAPDNENIHKTLKKAADTLTHLGSARVLCVVNVDPAVFNRQVHGGSAYNVYAILKVADLVQGLRGDKVRNAINLACLRSLIAFETAGVDFTGEMAKAAASDKVRVEPKARALLRSHTVSASTAPTQASSTMQALQTLGAVVNVGSVKSPLYRMTEAPVAAELARLAA